MPSGPISMPAAMLADTLIFRWQRQPRKSQQLFTQYLLNLQFT